MKLKELIKKRKEVEKIEPNSTVYLIDIDFSGFGVDDNHDVELYVAAGDKGA